MLKDDLHTSLSNGNIINRCSANEDEPAVQGFQSCNKTQQRGLPAPAIPDDDEQLLGANIQARLINRDNGTEFLSEVLGNEVIHGGA